MQKDGEPVGDLTTKDWLWVMMQREAMIES